jgi:hypothetical protein
MPDLSPTARAMAQAFDARYELCGPLEDRWHEVCLAAALRVLADHVERHWDGAECVDHLQTLAAELTGEPTPITTTETTDER